MPGHRILLAVTAGTLLLHGEARSDDWESIGPSGTNVTALAASPDYGSDGTLFAGTYGGGVYKTTDLGATWKQVNKTYLFFWILYGWPKPYFLYFWSLEDLENIEALGISPDYESDGTIYAGTVDRGIFQSMDGGEHWVRKNDGLGGLDIHSVCCSPEFATDQTVFTGIRYKTDGVYLSTDKGSNWEAAATSVQEPLPFAFSPDFASDQTLYVGTGSNGVRRSTDGGHTWYAYGPIGENVHSLVASPSSAKVKYLLAGTSGSGIYIRLESFTPTPKPGGAKLLRWTEVNNGLGAAESGIVEALAVSPLYGIDRKVFAAISAGTDSYVFETSVQPLIFPHVLEWNQVGSVIEDYQVDTMAVVEDSGKVRIFVGTASGTGGNGVLTMVVD